MVNETNVLDVITRQKVKRCSCDHTVFLEWANGSPELRSTLQIVGKINLKVGHQRSSQYWGLNTPIVLTDYPYNAADIFQCKACGLYFFHYMELGGHAAQWRYRVIRPSLFFQPAQQIIIDLSRVTKGSDIHDYLKTELSFPEFYGKNWDALWDAITGLVDMPKSLVLVNWDQYALRFPKDSGSLLRLSEDYNSLGYTDKRIEIIGDSYIYD